MILTSRFEEALVYAAQLHADQTRKGSDTPYIAHLMAVAAIVLEQGGDEDTAIAALLHDAVEDQGGPATREEIRGRFGERVTAIVDGCTDADTMPKPPWRPRKEAYISHLAEAPAEVLLVSAADKVHNARTVLMDYRIVGEDLWSRFTGGKEGTLWYYSALVKSFRAFGPPILADELARIVDELDRLVAANS